MTGQGVVGGDSSGGVAGPVAEPPGPGNSNTPRELRGAPERCRDGVVRIMAPSLPFPESHDVCSDYD
jgi:hypothetical protein